MLLIEQTIGAASANANNRNGFASNRSDCSEAAQLMRAEAEIVSVVPCVSWVKDGSEGTSACGAKRPFIRKRDLVVDNE